MCGVFATTEADAWRPHLDQVLAMLSRRGPDEHGVHEPAEGVLLVHTRLSIIGLGRAGAQPAASRDRSIALTFNGEIYNYPELAAALGNPAERSDTRVLADLLAQDEPAALADLRGMYAFAAWDRRTSTLLAMRDPFGIKPLYALQHATGGITLCSELGPLLLSPESRRLDDLGLAQYFAFGHTGPTCTMFEAIHKLVPGRLYRWQRETGTRWKRSTASPFAAVPRDQPQPIHLAVADSVTAHLVSDVEVGCFLSGGVDSTLLAAVAVQSAPELRTFTLAFPESPDRDESPLAATNAAQLGTRHTSVPATQREMAACARDFVREQGEPFGDAAALPLTLLARAAAEHVKVVLCGEGADELFGGYGRYRISGLLGGPGTAFRPLTAPVAPLWASVRSGKPWARAVEALLWGGGALSHAALLDGDVALLDRVRPDACAGLVDQLHSDWSALNHGDERARAQHYDLARWLPNVYLEKTDRATMASGLEARVPYLDTLLVRAAGAHAPVDSLKVPLRRVLLDLLPHVALPDRKKGLAVDIVPMVQTYLADEVAYELRDSRSVLRRWAGRAGAEQLEARSSRSPYLLFRIAMLGLWENEFDGARFACRAA
ncbi:MAG: asparagine synthase (glutamine-hydrolyzing) [Mycobacteriales bacterium]